MSQVWEFVAPCYGDKHHFANCRLSDTGESKTVGHGFHCRVAGEDTGDGDRHVHGVSAGCGYVAADEAEGLGPRFAGNSPEIYYEIFIMQMSRFDQIMPNVLDALCTTA